MSEYERERVDREDEERVEMEVIAERRKSLLSIGIIDFCKRCEDDANNLKCYELSQKYSNALQI